MEGQLGRIVVLCICIMLSAFFSATETAYSTLNKIKLKNLAQAGSKKAAKALDLAQDYDSLLTTILVGNNIVNIASTAIATLLFVDLLGQDLGATVSTAVMTVLVLIFGEISPKSMAKEMPERYAMAVASPIKLLGIVLKPINWFFSRWKAFLAQVFKVKGETGITEQELMTMVDEAAQSGGIDEQDSELIHSVMDFNDLCASDILTPRTGITGVPEEADRDLIRLTFDETGFSRLPVYRDTIDSIVGVVHLKDFYRNPNAQLNELKKQVLFATENIKVPSLLRLLQAKNAHIAVISDEFGGTVGIVTLEDIVEQLVGDIWDEHDEIIQEMEPLEDGSYRIGGGLDIDRMFRMFDIKEECNAATVSGWIVSKLGYIPMEGESFFWDNLRIKVTKAEARRVIEIEVKTE